MSRLSIFMVKKQRLKPEKLGIHSTIGISGDLFLHSLVERFQPGAFNLK